MHPTLTLQRIPIDAITVGSRHRKDFGDLTGLAEDMNKNGQLQPIRLTPELVLAFGERRLRAAKMLNWSEIDAVVGDIDDLLAVEFAENDKRKAFNPAEVYDIYEELKVQEAKKAQARQAAGKLPEGPKGDSRDLAAKRLGLSGKTMDKMGEIMSAARADPDEYGGLVDQVMSTGKVSGAYKKLKQKQEEERVLGLEPVIGKFPTLILDPPWPNTQQYSDQVSMGYAEMSLSDIDDIEPVKWATDDCMLYLWTTNNFIGYAWTIMEGWGFEHRTVLTWVKPKWGYGYYYRNQTEHVLVGTRGKAMTRRDDRSTIIEGPPAENKHSSKPEAFYELVKEMSYPPYGEGFQVKNRDGFVNLFKPV